MIGLLRIATCLALLAGAAPVAAQKTAATVSLALDGQISAAGDKVQLSWDPSLKGTSHAFRRALAQTGRDSWQPVTPSVRSPARLMESDVPTGTAWEYRVEIRGKDKPRIGYWATGHNVPAQANQGVALVIVDDSLAAPLAAHLDRFTLDLIGAGWQVQQHLAPRHNATDMQANLHNATALRGWIAGQYRHAPETPHAVILIGHLPVIDSGWSAPDGHEPRAMPSDLFYADPNGVWRPGRRGEDGQPPALRPDRLPANGIAMQIGRVDFAGLGPDFGGEVPLLRAYLDRDHHWRHGWLGDLRSAYGKSDHLKTEQNALRNIVGPRNIAARGHHDAQPEGPFLMGVDFGHWNGAEYVTLPPARAVFTINFGSHKHIFDQSNNAMTALLAQSWYPLSTGWGGRPSWQLHGMAMGETIGQAHLRTVNNGQAVSGYGSREYAQTGKYDWINPVWANLLGDPTLAAFPLPSPEAFTATTTPDGVRLSWVLPEGADGAYLFRAEERDGPYTPLAGGALLTGDTFLDDAPAEGSWYMLRAAGLAQVYAGSFQRLSQGRFAVADHAAPVPGSAGTLTAPIIAPDGVVTRDSEGWHVTRATTLEVSGFDGVTSTRGELAVAP